MRLVDVNVLVHAYHSSMPLHVRVRPWLERQVDGDEPLALSELVASAFVRVITNAKAFVPNVSTGEAFEAMNGLRLHPNCRIVSPGPTHFDTFDRLCRDLDARGKLVPDLYLAALAIEHDCEWISDDRDFARVPGLRWTRLTDVLDEA